MQLVNFGDVLFLTEEFTDGLMGPMRRDIAIFQKYAPDEN